MNILFVTDKKGRIQYNRAKILQKLIQDHNIDIVTLKDVNVNWNKYDLVYYSHFSLLKKNPAPKNKEIITSITSHKCLSDFDKTLKILKQFKRVSVNNTLLLNEFKGHVDNLYYTPNGVDTSFFTPKIRGRNDEVVFGWVGNADRATKRYNEIIIPLKEKYNFKIVATSKKDGFNDLLDKSQMRDYYHNIDFLVVSSLTEGTPNPALESMSCGTPVISSKVGNMVEIIKESYNGFISDGSIENYMDILHKAKKISRYQYDIMSRRIFDSIYNWDWSIKYKEWYNFLIGS